MHERCLDGWLIGIPELHALRAPGNTCLSALRVLQSPSDRATNNSKGCGGVMRVAPVGLFGAGSKQPGISGHGIESAFELACGAAAITHGHPTGQHASGLFADIIERVALDATLQAAIEQGLDVLRTWPDHDETERIVLRAVELAAQGSIADPLPAELGAGWIAEEALAIALYAALLAPGLESGVILAVNHGGDSDSTGAIAGNLLGLMHGLDAIPSRWLDGLELREVIEAVADDLASMWFWTLDDGEDDDSAIITAYYPGS